MLLMASPMGSCLISAGGLKKFCTTCDCACAFPGTEAICWNMSSSMRPDDVDLGRRQVRIEMAGRHLLANRINALLHPLDSVGVIGRRERAVEAGGFDGPIAIVAVVPLSYRRVYVPGGNSSSGLVPAPSPLETVAVVPLV